MSSGNHPVEVVGRIRGHPDREFLTALSVPHETSSVRVKTDQGYRDFMLDGVSASESENLPAFYSKYVESRVDDVRTGGRCTVMMYGPTGSGKSHTMFGSAREPGVAYSALRQIMSEGVQVNATVLEIYNEEIYDLLVSGTTSNPLASPGPKSRTKLEVRGKKVRNATCIVAGDPMKLVQEIAKVEKRRVIKNTNCNDRSSRSHCMVIIDILGVNGRLVLVDMAGSENSDQAGSAGPEAKIQTGKINQGNSALRRVVECIANGAPYIPYRDSKLTMLLQDSFEDDASKILMVLCASPDARDVHKTICTLEYGAKAKCIVRLPSSPPKETAAISCPDRTEAVLQAKLRLKDERLEKMRLDLEEKQAELERLAGREQEVATLRLKLNRAEEENTQKLKEYQKEMDRTLAEKCEEMKRKLVLTDAESRRAEMERMVDIQKREITLLRSRAEKAEAALRKYQEALRSGASSELSPESTGMLALEAKSLSNVTPVESLNLWATPRSKPAESFTFSSSENPGVLQDFNFATKSGSSSQEQEQQQDILSTVSSTNSGCPDPASSIPKLIFTESPSIKNNVRNRREKLQPQQQQQQQQLKQQQQTQEQQIQQKQQQTQQQCFSPDARRARIENIFMLCGDRRERKPANATTEASGNARKGNKENLVPPVC